MLNFSNQEEAIAYFERSGYVLVSNKKSIVIMENDFDSAVEIKGGKCEFVGDKSDEN